jgi:L-cysteine/cystine lyase
VVRTADVGAGDSDQTVSAIAGAMTQRTRLIALSHVSFSTGACLPIKQIAALAHSAGAHLLVDGAQAVAAIPVDVRDLDVEYYAFPGQKWLCGPEGTGGLYVRRESQTALQPTFVSIRTDHAVAAARYEYSTVFRPGIHGLHAALGWLDSLGREAIFRRTSELATYCYQRVSALPGIEPLTPREALAGIVNLCFSNDVDLDGVVTSLQDERVTVRSIPDTRSLRVSCAFFNTVEEIDALCRALAAR